MYYLISRFEVFIIALSMSGLLQLGIAQIIKVPSDHTTIQSALNSCKAGDTVLVSPGTYFENIIWPKVLSIYLKSEKGSVSTILDGGERNSVININVFVDSLSTIDGFTIQNGKAENGGGIYCTSRGFRLINNIIKDNNAGDCGGGIACINNSNPFIYNNEIFNNYADYKKEHGGGGIYCYSSSPWIESNKIYNNKAYVGAGIHCRISSSPTILNNEIFNNDVYNSCSAICCNDRSNPLIKDNLIKNNRGAYAGGGIGCYNNSSPVIDGNEIIYNSAELYGGGIDIWIESSPIIRNNIIKFNSSTEGGGIRIHRDCNPEIIDCIISNNVSSKDGGGIYIHDLCFPIIRNCSITDNQAGQNGAGIFSNHSTPKLKNLYIYRNAAAQSGGGFYFLFGDITFENVTISENKAQRGGGIFFDNIRTLEFSNKNFSSIYLNNAAYQGDELYINADRSLAIKLDTFTVKYPNEIHIYPLNMSDFSFINTRINQEDSDLYVSGNGNDSNSGVSSSKPLRSLNLAIAKVLSSNSTLHSINLLEGNYDFHYLPPNISLTTDFQSDLVYSGNNIVVVSPVWKSTWALLLYLLTLTGIVYTIWRIQVRRIKIKHAYEMSMFEAQKLHEVDEMKSRFFANISHEFRTPLTLILGLAKQTIERTKEVKTKEDATVVHRSANRLHELVNQLLDLSKLEAGSMKLQTCEENIVPVIKGLVLSFASFAERKKICLKFQSEKENIEVFIDRDKLEKIVTNLLSNAFKFTAEGGKVEVNVKRTEDKVEIIISDTGSGIPRERLEKIFERFYQVDDSHTRKQEGTGIGLALTKELVELHKGEIEVESEDGKGTTFTVRLRLGKDHLAAEEILEMKPEKEVEIPTPFIEEVSEVEKREEKPEIEMITDTDKPLLLIVEDNADVRNYIRGYLENENRILEAVDGKNGLEKATEHIPDLVVSDVMMPEMDGFELCKELKTDERTSHIPIILLTAKSSDQDKIDGLETGADDYIMKPFDSKELQVRIKNLIEQRKKLREIFSREAEIPIKKGKYSQVDEQFLRNTMDIIHSHITEPEFSLEDFGKEIGMSRMQLHRKIKALTDYSPHQFIRFIRLKKAAELLNKGTGNVTEIAYDVGFNSLSHFAKAFREQFGKSPSEFNQIN
jgi:parallel beta-helix repeat protein